MLVIVLSIHRLVKVSQASSFTKALRLEWAGAVCIIHCSAGLLFVGALCGFHAYLVATNQTTYEYFRGRSQQNSFQRSCMRNCWEAVCGMTRLYAYYPNDRHPALVRANGSGHGAVNQHQLHIHDRHGHQNAAEGEGLTNGHGYIRVPCSNALHDALQFDNAHEMDGSMLPQVPHDIQMQAEEGDCRHPEPDRSTTLQEVQLAAHEVQPCTSQDGANGVWHAHANSHQPALWQYLLEHERLPQHQPSALRHLPGHIQ
jgi:hypothetical protein